MFRNRPFRRNCTPAGGNSIHTPLIFHFRRKCADGRRHVMRRLSRSRPQLSKQPENLNPIRSDQAQAQASQKGVLRDKAVVTLSIPEAEHTTLTCRANRQVGSPRVSAIFGSKPVATSVRLHLLAVHADGRDYTLVGVQSRSRQSFWVLSSRPVELHNGNLFAQVSECFDRVLGPGARWRTGDPDEDSVSNV